MRYHWLHCLHQRKLQPSRLLAPSCSAPLPRELFLISQLATLAGPLAGEELHGLCFLLEKVEITDDCLGGTGAANAHPPATAVVPPPPPSSSAVDGISAGGGSAAPPVLSSEAVDEDGGVSASKAMKSVGVDGDGGGEGEKGDVLEPDVLGGENDAGDNASVGKGSVRSGATGSNAEERREPRQVRALPRYELCSMRRKVLEVFPQRSDVFFFVLS